MQYIPILSRVRALSRFAAASLRNGTVRFYVGNLPAFYKALNHEGVSYVVLRWSEDLPQRPEAEALRTDDVDHLIADRDISRVMRIAARHPGPVKTDHYSVGGRRGSSYKSMPYYMPVLAERILAGRRLDPRGFYRPSAEDEFFAFAYHLCFHKGLESGIEAGLPDCPAPALTDKDYAAELRRLATVAGREHVLPDPLSLYALYGMLRDHGWAMPADLMTRWPKRHAFLNALLAEERLRAEPLIAAAQGHTVFVLRDDCDRPDLEQLAVSMIAERFTICETLRLDPAMRANLIARTRGGSWVEKGRGGVVAPTVVVFCRDAPVPGPIPSTMSARKIARRYPHISNTDVLIKRNIRDAVNAAAGPPQGRVVIHATDNAFECAEVFSALFGQDALARMQALFGADQAPPVPSSDARQVQKP